MNSEDTGTIFQMQHFFIVHHASIDLFHAQGGTLRLPQDLKDQKRRRVDPTSKQNLIKLVQKGWRLIEHPAKFMMTLRWHLARIDTFSASQRTSHLDRSAFQYQILTKSGKETWTLEPKIRCDETLSSSPLPSGSNNQNMNFQMSDSVVILHIQTQ